MEPQDDEIVPHPSRVLRAVLIVVGVIATILGIIGVFLPVMPTTPFLLVAAAAFARASPTLYRRLLDSPAFGPAIREWRHHRSIRWRTKLTAIALIAISFTTSIVFFVEPPWAKAAMALVGLAVAAWLWRVPSRDRPS